MKSVIFDLDLTLVDSSIAEQERRNRNWNKVYSLIPNFVVYKGLEVVFEYIRANDIKVCIVSTAPEPYILKVVNYFHIPYHFIVDYYGAKPIKPHPAPMLKAIYLLEQSPINVINFGDRVIDMQSGKAANIKSVGCLWGSNEKELLSTYSDFVIETPEKMLPFFKN